MSQKLAFYLDEIDRSIDWNKNSVKQKRKDRIMLDDMKLKMSKLKDQEDTISSLNFDDSVQPQVLEATEFLAFYNCFLVRVADQQEKINH